MSAAIEIRFTVNGDANASSLSPHEAPARRAARRPAADRHQGRLRRRRMRLLFRAHEWRAREQLPRPRAAGRGRHASKPSKAWRPQWRLHPLQQAFLACGGAQCGICTPGMLMAATHLLAAQSASHARGNSRGPGWKSLPLHRLHPHLRIRALAAAQAEPAQTMRGDAAAHELDRARHLAGVLELIAHAPGQWTPIAGGTELMVAHAAGRLRASKLVSLWGIPTCASSRAPRNLISIGAGATFTDMRRHTLHPRGISPARSRCKLDRLHRQSEPRHHRRQPRQRIAGRRLVPGAAGLRR